MFDNNIALFGFGSYGHQVADILSAKVKYIFDNDETKWGKKYNNIIVKDPNELKELSMEMDILITIPKQYVEAVKNQLQDMGLGLKGKIFDAHDFYEEDGIIRYKVLFSDQYSDIKQYELDSPRTSRLLNLGQMLMNVMHLPGNVAECGVYKGDSALFLGVMLRKYKANKTLHLFDTFEGMLEVDKNIDLHRKGDFQDTSLDFVKSKLNVLGNIPQFHQGLFSDTLSVVSSEKFSLVHIDCDIYPSVLECCNFFYPLMSKNGVMVFDDYGWYSCPGARKAVDEFFSSKLEKQIYFETGQCIVIKQ